MSLLFDHAISTFEPEADGLYVLEGGDRKPLDDPIPVRPIVKFASDHTLEHPEPGTDYTCIPLHREDSAELTGEFLAYSDDELRGEVIICRTEDEREAIDLDDFARTQLARRIRFWHSDYRPESYPPDYDRPIDDNEPPRNPVDSDDFLDGLVAYVRDERDAQRRTWEDRAERYTLEQLSQQYGAAIPSVTYADGGEGTVTFRVDPGPHHDPERTDWSYFVPDEFGIYQGNEVLLHGRWENFPIPATVENIYGLEITLAIDWGVVSSPTAVKRQLTNGDTFGVSQRLNPVPTDRELKAIDRLRDHPILDVFVGTRPITFSNGAAARSEPLDTELNQEQQLASELALLADDVFCIHGPPGTGKTRTLVEIVRRAVQADETVLVCADSNQAVDNIVAGDSTPEESDPRSLHAYAQHGSGELTLRRVNGHRRPSEIIQQYADVPESVDVVAGTNNSVAEVVNSFDLLVLDEATQSTCASSCIPITKADRVVLAGDHKQLPPFSSTEEPPESSLGLSLFEHIYAEGGVYEGVGIKLTTQYRMHRDIADFPNREFYDRELRNGRDVDRLPGREEALEAFDIGGSVDIHDHSRSNKNEAKLVVHLARQLLSESGLSPEEIGVITPYSAQCRVIEETLEAYIEDGDRIPVDTIDSFQGGEREAILISLVRSNADGEIGFLGRPTDGPRRLNVALTRAKRYCAVIGDFCTLRQDADGKCTGLYERFDKLFADTKRRRDVDPEFLI